MELGLPEVGHLVQFAQPLGGEVGIGTQMCLTLSLFPWFWLLLYTGNFGIFIAVQFRPLG